jgi:RNA polymerase primary sigma factor
MNTLITGTVKFYSQTQNKEFIEILKHYPPFTPEEEIQAFERLKSGDESALNEIVARNQRWVYSLAKEYARDEIEVMDYVQEGNFGLMEAIEKYDIEKGYKFITFAVWYIRQKMNLYMNGDRDAIKKSNNAKYAKKVEKIKNDFFINNGYMPSFDDIKDILLEKYNIEVKNERDLYDLEINSIDAHVNDDTTFEDCDVFTSATATDDGLCDKEDNEYYKELVIPILNCLPEKNKEFIKKLYHIGYGDEYTLDKICSEYGLDEAGLRQMENNILKYMKQSIVDEFKKAI